MQTMNASLAIATVPVQPWGEVYEEDKALRRGTIFPDLDMPFYVVDDIMDSPITTGRVQEGKQPQQQQREELLNRIYQVSFFLNDLNLYLDTHGQDKDALALFAEKGKERSKLLTEFAEQFYPLTPDCIVKCTDCSQENLWAKGPMPWEGACV